MSKENCKVIVISGNQLLNAQVYFNSPKLPEHVAGVMAFAHWFVPLQLPSRNILKWEKRKKIFVLEVVNDF